MKVSFQQAFQLMWSNKEGLLSQRGRRAHLPLH
jgi:hypothetical protein